MREFHDWPWPADPNIGLVLGTVDISEGAFFIRGPSEKDRVDARVYELEMEIMEMKDAIAMMYEEARANG